MKILLIRFLIAAVVFVNLQCAAAFLTNPELYAPGFELSGETGLAAVRGFGLLFLMWNIPYLAAILHPIRNRTSLYEAVVMQTIGLLGEIYILQTIPLLNASARASILRFITFDAAGLAVLILAIYLTKSVIVIQNS